MSATSYGKSPAVGNEPSVPDADETGLAKNVLSEVQVLAESVGMIGPSLGAAALIPLAFGVAGGGTWLTVLISMAGMLAVAGVVSVLAHRHVSMGALYSLVPKGLGPTGGFLVMGGFALIALAGEMTAVLGFGSTFAQFLASAFGIGHSGRAEIVVLDLVGLALATGVTLRGISVSTGILLVLEGISMVAILVLLLIVAVKHGHVIDSHQLGLHGATAHGILLSLTFLALAFGGFESATALGVEARQPRRAIPIALFGSILVVGVFFLLNSYIQVLGFEGTGLNIASQAVPLGTLASHYGVKWLGDIVLLGVAFSFLSVTVAWLNYAPRPTLAMASEGVLPRWFGRTNPRTGVPSVSLLFWAASWLIVTLFLVVTNANLTQAFNNIGALAGYGYTMLYLLLGIAAIAYAFRHGLMIASFVAAAVVTCGVMILEYWYSFNPLPAHPLDLWVYGFGIFVLVLVIGCVAGWVLAPGWMRRMGRIEEADSSDG